MAIAAEIRVGIVAALKRARSDCFIPATQGGQAIGSWEAFSVRFAPAG